MFADVRRRSSFCDSSQDFRIDVAGIMTDSANRKAAADFRAMQSAPRQINRRHHAWRGGVAGRGVTFPASALFAGVFQLLFSSMFTLQSASAFGCNVINFQFSRSSLL